MPFMVIERFRNGDVRPIGERFKESGRMPPEGVECHASWVDTIGAGCFQVMGAPNPELLKVWIGRWDDLIDFEVIPVVASSEFWS
jgi:hypothetical protein